MILINLISMLSGFIRDSSIAIQLGATNISDIFMFIINLPTVLFSAFSWVIMSSFIPIYTDIMVNEDEKSLNKFSNTFIKLSFIICSIVVAGLYIFNKLIIKILAPGFIGNDFLITKKLFFIIIPTLIFMGISSCIVGILNANKKMLWVSLFGIPINVVTIFSTLVILPKFNIEIATFIIMLGSLLQLLIFMYPLNKTGFNVTKDFDLKSENMKKTMKIIGPMVIGVMAQQINSMFAGAITSTLATGSLTSYNLASKIVNAAYSSIILIGISYIFPYLSQDYASGFIEEFKSKIRNSIHIIFLILIPITILISTLSEEVITILYGYGKFSAEAIEITSKILIFLAIGLVFLAIKELISRAYYAGQNTKTPMLHNIIGIVINIVLGVVLSRMYGVEGVAVALTMSIVISTLTISINFIRDYKISLIKLNEVIKYAILTIVLISFAKYFRNFVFGNVNVFLTIIGTGIASLVIYVLSIIILKIDIKSYMAQFK